MCEFTRGIMAFPFKVTFYILFGLITVVFYEVKYEN
jgi:hypothetical protein